MKQKFAMVAATFALGFLLSAPAGAGDATKNGSGGAPPGYGANWGGSTNNCGNCGGGHNKNGGGGHNKNGGGGGGGNVGGGGNSNDLLCYVGGRAVYVASRRECRRLVYSYNYGGDYAVGGGDGYNYGHGDGYTMSRATRMQLRKRARQGYVAHGGRKVHGRKLRHSSVRRARGHGGKTIIINNYGGQVQINKGGAN
jgi:hypothetical protein